jgi:exopolyphosphatase/guanosine-5'-triphosphate,3'-diphosphate pyrophosphatase
VKRIAVVDLGTNTFHLLVVADKGNGEHVEIYRERAYVRLGEEGLEKIGIAAFKRGIEALQKFRGIMDLFEVVAYKAYGTSALRNAVNADVFIRTAEQKAGILVEVIPGRREAELIFEGTKKSGAVGSTPVLVVDVGGGSVEFIIGTMNTIHFYASLKIGVAFLYKRFHHTDPLSVDIIEQMEAFLSLEMAEVLEKIKTFQPYKLVGSSGTFDVIGDHLGLRQHDLMYKKVNVQETKEMIKQVLPLNMEQRLSLDYIPNSRADLIAVALVLIDFLLSAHPFEEILISPYAMKEGMIAELMRERVGN